jgi:hypothetical protein
MGFDMRLALVGATALLLTAAPAAASTCEASFAKKGNPLSGLKFTAMQSVADISTPNAINQLRGIVLAKGYDVLAIEAEAGSMLIEQPQTANRRSFQIIASATTEGKITTVQLQANLRGGQFAKEEGVKIEICGVLSQMRGGKAGVAAASQGRNAAAGGGAPIVMSAQLLAQRLSQERDKNEDAIPLRYKGKSFTLSGTVDYVKKDGDEYRVAFKILERHEMVIKLPGESQFKTEISCMLAKGQSVYALTLKPKANVKLTGTYSNYRGYPFPSVMWLDNCRPVK